MEDIIKLLPHLLRLSQNNEEVCERASFAAWRVAVGEAIARASQPLRLTRKVLVVAVMDETWRRQLEQMSTQILFKLNTIMGAPFITGLDFYVDRAAVQAARPASPPPLSDQIEPDPVIERAAAQITDAELRQRFLKTASKYLQRRDSNNR